MTSRFRPTKHKERRNAEGARSTSNDERRTRRRTKNEKNIRYMDGSHHAFNDLYPATTIQKQAYISILTPYMTSDMLNQILEELKGSGATLKCEDMRRYLERLGFDVRDGKKEGHKIVTHKGLPSFYSTSYTCGHGKNPEINPQYVQSIRKTLLQHEEELKAYLKEQQE